MGIKFDVIFESSVHGEYRHSMHRSFAIYALENHVTFFSLLTGPPAQPARKHAGKIAPVLSSKSRTPARTPSSLDVIFPLPTPTAASTAPRKRSRKETCIVCARL